jgi:hypothetical protein
MSTVYLNWRMSSDIVEAATKPLVEQTAATRSEALPYVQKIAESLQSKEAAAAIAKLQDAGWDVTNQLTSHHFSFKYETEPGKWLSIRFEGVRTLGLSRNYLTSPATAVLPQTAETAAAEPYIRKHIKAMEDLKAAKAELTKLVEAYRTLNALYKAWPGVISYVPNHVQSKMFDRVAKAEPSERPTLDSLSDVALAALAAGKLSQK